MSQARSFSQSSYPPEMLLALVDAFWIEHPTAPESLFEELFETWIDAREMTMNADVVITDGVLRYLEGGDV
jgi:hypothetical protein